MSAKKNTGLGRGFDALIPKGLDVPLLSGDAERIQKLFITDIFPHADQPRKHFDEVALQELAASIKRHGVVQPIIISPAKNNKYTIIAGERRWRAAKLAGLTKIPAIVRSSEDLEQLEIALIENVQRVDLSPLEQAVSVQKLHDQFNIGYEEIAKRLGKAATTISNIVRLLQLPLQVQKALHDQTITEGHARAILAIKDESGQLTLLKLIIKNNWTVRQAEQYVTAQKAGAKTPKAARKHLDTTTPATQKLSQSIKAPITIKRTAKGGKLEITFLSDKDLERIIKILSATR